VAIQERIREIIGAEDKAHPLSDEEVVTILRERDGTRVARRTVTKYRQALDIPSSTMRKTH
jgi:RNA polymerase sigma-54 factor